MWNNKTETKITWKLKFKNEEGIIVYITQDYLDFLNLTEQDSHSTIMKTIKNKLFTLYDTMSYFSVSDNEVVYFYDVFAKGQEYNKSFKETEDKRVLLSYFIDQNEDFFISVSFSYFDKNDKETPIKQMKLT